MKVFFIMTTVLVTLLFIAGCENTMYVCSSGDQVSNPDLCPGDKSSSEKEEVSAAGSAPTRSSSSSDSDLMGNWYCKSSQGNGNLVFKSRSKLVLSGKPFDYSISGSTLTIMSGGMSDEYKMTHSSDTLTLKYHDGFVMSCSRGSGPESSSGTYASGSDTGYNGDSGSAYYQEGYDPYASGYEEPTYEGGGYYSDGSYDASDAYYDESAGYGGGAYENPSSGYYDYGSYE